MTPVTRVDDLRGTLSHRQVLTIISGLLVGNFLAAIDATVVSTTTVGVGWGIGLEWFLRPHWSLSFDALNPLFSIAKTSTDRPLLLSDSSRTVTTYGAVFDPTVRLMAHLFF